MLKKKEVPHTIDDSEGIVRLVIHYFHYSRKKDSLKPEALTPKPIEKDVISVERLDFTELQYCKKRGLRIAEIINGASFIGIAAFTAKAIRAISKDNTGKYRATIEASPLDEDQNKRSKEEQVFTTDAGVPCHADLKYSNIEVTKGAPLPGEFKEFVLKPLLEVARAHFFKDEVVTPEWVGDEVVVDGVKYV